jgi:hypothetical protein
MDHKGNEKFRGGTQQSDIIILNVKAVNIYMDRYRKVHRWLHREEIDIVSLSSF